MASLSVSVLERAKRATQMIFLILGLAVSGWAPMVPFAKDRLRLDESGVGLLLLFLGIGSILAAPLTNWLIKIRGTRIVIAAGAIVVAITLPSLALISNLPAMAFALFIFGFGLASIDISMNTQGSHVQTLSGKHIMSSLHGLFSVGGLIGPLFMAAILKLGLTPFTGAIIIAVALLIITFTQYKYLLSAEGEDQVAVEKPLTNNSSNKKTRLWLHGSVLFLGIMCFIAFLSEGAMLDWSALLLRDSKGVDEAFAGLGYAFFSIAMAVMRLFGDKIVARVNARSVVLFGSIIAFGGYILVVFLPGAAIAVIGFLLIGTGAANIVPIFISAAGRLKNVPSAAALSVISAIGYIGQLAGPALLGILAKHFSLPNALFGTGVLLLLTGISFSLSKVATQKTIHQLQ